MTPGHKICSGHSIRSGLRICICHLNGVLDKKHVQVTLSLTCYILILWLLWIEYLNSCCECWVALKRRDCTHSFVDLSHSLLLTDKQRNNMIFHFNLNQELRITILDIIFPQRNVSLFSFIDNWMETNATRKFCEINVSRKTWKIWYLISWKKHDHALWILLILVPKKTTKTRCDAIMASQNGPLKREAE